MPPYVYAEARESAAYHVQVKVLRVDRSCSVTGEVVRVFRAQGTMVRLGQRVHFKVACLRPGAPEPPPGPVLWMEEDELRKAAFMEVYLNPTDAGGVAVPLWQQWRIDEPTDAPIH